jgi:GDPmannose 4,6-dehydratase
MPVSLILGVNGQDGSYLAESLLRRGHEVVGVGRDSASRYVRGAPRFHYAQCDLRDLDALSAVVRDVQPSFAFHTAAVHGAAGFMYEPSWRDMMAVNVSALHVLLEFGRISNRDLRVVYAGSAKVFPGQLEGEIDETTPMRATCLYGIGKIASRDLLAHYRAAHGIRSTNLVLFNHESPRRRPEYFVPTIARTIARAKRDPAYCTQIKTLDFRVDWSSAAELMDIVAEIAVKSEAPQLVLGSGTTWHARAAIEQLFESYGLQAYNHIIEASPRSDPGPDFQVSLALLESATGRRPMRTIFEIVQEMVADESR